MDKKEYIQDAIDRLFKTWLFRITAIGAAAFPALSLAIIYGIYLIPIIMGEPLHDFPLFFTTNFFICSIILIVLIFRRLSMQSLRRQLDVEYELIKSSRQLQESEEIQRLLLQNANKEKEAKMSAMLESFDSYIYICSPDYRIEFMNEKLLRKIGRNAVGEACYAALNDFDSICPWCVNENVLKGETIRYEIQSPRDGLWYQVLNTPIRHPDGSVSKQAMFMNITERKKADMELRDSEERYKRLLSSVTDYIYTVQIRDGKPSVTEHGEGCIAVTGYSPGHYSEDPDLWYRMVYDADRHLVLEQANKALTGEKTEPLDHRLVHRNGSLRWVRNTLVPRYSATDQLLSIEGLISDITENRRLEERLKNARKLEEENLKIFSRCLIDV